MAGLSEKVTLHFYGMGPPLIAALVIVKVQPETFPPMGQPITLAATKNKNKKSRHHLLWLSSIAGQ